MKTISWLLTIMYALNFSLATAQDAGGGGIQENGVYKTLYSAGVTISTDPETEVPGTDLYLKTVKSLISGQPANRLLTSALPIGNRVYYRILEDQADKDVIKRLLKEYAKITGNEDDQLTIFAITDRSNGEDTTYLLPSFYKLKKSEQAAVLFHEAYMILSNGDSTPAQNAYAEMAFQEFIEKDQAGSYSNKLPRLLDTLFSLQDVAFLNALRADARLQTVPSLIDKEMRINVKKLFGEQCNTYLIHHGDGAIIAPKTYYEVTEKCWYDKASLSDVLELAPLYPKSYVMKEMANFVNAGHTVYSESLVYTTPQRRFARESQQAEDAVRRDADEYFAQQKALIHYDLLRRKNDDDNE